MPSSSNVDRIPDYMKKVLMAMINKSSKSLETLIAYLQEELKNNVFTGEIVQLRVKHDGKPIKGEVVQIENCIFRAKHNPSKEKENQKTLFTYGVKLIDGPILSNVPPTDFERCGYIPSRNILRKLVRASAIFVADEETGCCNWLVDDKAWMAKKQNGKLLSKKTSSLGSKRKSEEQKPTDGPPFKKLASIKQTLVAVKSEHQPRINESKPKLSNGCSSPLHRPNCSPAVTLNRLELKKSNGKKLMVNGNDIKGKAKKKLKTAEASNPKKMKQMTLFEMSKSFGKITAASPLKQSAQKLSNGTGGTSEQPSMLKPSQLSPSKAIESKKPTKLMNETSSALKSLPVVPNSPSSANGNVKLVAPKINLLDFNCLLTIPSAKLITPLAGFLNEWIGDSVMVIQFVTSFSNALLPNKALVLTTDNLIQALNSGEEGCFFLGQVLLCLVQTLLEGGKNYMELGISLQATAFSYFSVSEGVRLCLKQCVDESYTVPSEELDLLETKDFCQLKPDEKLVILNALCNKVLNCVAVQEYLKKLYAKRKEVNILYHKMASERNKKLHQQMIEGDKSKIKNPDVEISNDENALKPEIFYGQSEENGELDLSFIVKNRRTLAEKAKKEREEREALERKRRFEEAKKAKEHNEFEQIRKQVQSFREEIQMTQSCKCLGVDRDLTRYWWFPHYSYGLVLEKQWLTEASDHVALEDSGKYSAKTSKNSCSQSKWYYYENSKDVTKLIGSLSNMVPDERLLRINLKSKRTEILQRFQTAEKDNTPNANNTKRRSVKPSDETISTFGSFRQDITDLASRLVSSALGGVPDHDAWICRVMDAKSVQEFVPCLLDLQASIQSRFFSEAFVGRAEEGSEAAKEKKNSDKMSKWRQMVTGCGTMSRLHFLLGILESSIYWKKYAMNNKCVVCRKKDDEAFLLLCDNCNKGFHLSCLRPALDKVPEGDWFCGSCKKPATGKYAKMEEGSCDGSELSEDEDDKNEEDEDDEDEDEEEEAAEEENKELICCMKRCRKLKTDEDLVMCSSCSKAYHKQCHCPPLRNHPRGSWICSKCSARKPVCKKQSLRKK